MIRVLTRAWRLARRCGMSRWESWVYVMDVWMLR